MNTLITGAGGMVGSHLIERLWKQNKNVIGTFYKPTINIAEIKGKATLIECDIRYPQSIENIIDKYKPARIFHLAAQSYPTISWERPYETIETNVGGTVAVFEAVKRIRVVDAKYDPVIVVACSSAEYGATLDELNGVAVREDAKLQPLHPYGVSKVGQDLLAYQYWKNDKIRTIRARIFNTTGVRKVNDVTSDFIKRAVELENKGDIILRVGNTHTKRAIMDVEDLVSALLLLSERGKWGDVYNICSEKIYEIADIIEIIEEKMGIKYKLEIDNALIRSTDENVIVGNTEKLRKDTDWKQCIELETTIENMIEYQRGEMNKRVVVKH